MNKTDLAFKTSIEELNIEPRGIIHAGFGVGFDLQFYVDLGFKDAMLIEANSEGCRYVQGQIEKLEDKIQTVLIWCAISDFEGEADFHITNNLDCSSLLKPKELLTYYPKIKLDRVEKVQVTTMNKLFSNCILHDIKNYNVLNIDIQGSELDAIKGATDLLPYLDLINLEVENVYLYENNAITHEVVDYLRDKGFKMYRKTIMAKNGSFDDMIFVKESLIK
jgi:FkbM family methyltransferase